METIKLVSHSIGVNGESLKDLVVYCARVSNPTSQEAGENVDRLWNYLKRHKHWSPFEMVNICMEINCPRDIARQILRHRSFSFQEFSQRYADPIEALTFQLRSARLQDETNRQNSIPVDDISLQHLWVKQQNRVKDVAITAYQAAVDRGIAKEVARSVLPEGLTMSRLYMNGSLRSWLHWIEVRENEDTQLEHRKIALEAKEIIGGLIE